VPRLQGCGAAVRATLKGHSALTPTRGQQRRSIDSIGPAEVALSD